MKRRRNPARGNLRWAYGLDAVVTLAIESDQRLPLRKIVAAQELVDQGWTAVAVDGEGWFVAVVSPDRRRAEVLDIGDGIYELAREVVGLASDRGTFQRIAAPLRALLRPRERRRVADYVARRKRAGWKVFDGDIASQRDSALLDMSTTQIAELLAIGFAKVEGAR